MTDFTRAALLASLSALALAAAPAAAPPPPAAWRAPLPPRPPPAPPAPAKTPPAPPRAHPKDSADDQANNTPAASAAPAPRRTDRTLADSPVPVDVIGAEAISNT